MRHINRKGYLATVKREFDRQPLVPEVPLTEADIAHVPAPVQQYITYTGALGKSKPQNARIVFKAQMFNKPGAAPMEAVSEQYNFLGVFTRIFFMRARMFCVPVRALHVYAEQQATFVVRAASLVNVVDLAGPELTTAETVTLLNDLCLLAPGCLGDPRFSWQARDERSAQVTFTNGPYTVSAVLYFNERGELVNFISEDRLALQNDGALRQAPWSTPIRDYRDINGRRIPTYGETIWHYPEGDFTYGKFTVQDIAYNVKACHDR